MIDKKLEWAARLLATAIIVAVGVAAFLLLGVGAVVEPLI